MILLTCVCTEESTFTISRVLCTLVLATDILSSIGFCKQIKNCSHRFALHPITELLFPFSPSRTESLLSTSSVDLEMCMETGNTMLQAFLSLSKKHRFKVHLKETGLKVVDGIHLIFIGMSESMTLLPKCTSC
jgi:hypothetical protein